MKTWGEPTLSKAKVLLRACMYQKNNRPAVIIKYGAKGG
ncbi:hypothetical protein M23134_05070 [Microscilla marina ATCC 23134]|uniref:Uncharacterized protein n=1 Tax=Microscilla marina ATCC 23134 TaxID=313606 RepID=A1ZD25_MICM2|nr:hypothetical protein M23134_05070 [Microscilla marina ATCC 23134]